MSWYLMFALTAGVSYLGPSSESDCQQLKRMMFAGRPALCVEKIYMRPTEKMVQRVFDAISHNGIYERDLLHKLVGSIPQRTVEEALTELALRGFIKKAGDNARPIYVRLASKRVVYANLKPLAPHATESLLQMHANFEENPR